MDTGVPVVLSLNAVPRVELNLAVDRLAQLAEDRLGQLSERMLLPRAASSNVKARSPERKEHVGRARVRRV